MRFRKDENNKTTYPDGSVVVHTSGPFATIALVRKCLCPDGKRRTAIASGYADTAWSVPGHLIHKGKTVAGSITVYTMDDGNEGWRFVPDSRGKNGNIFNDEHDERAWSERSER